MGLICGLVILSYGVYITIKTRKNATNVPSYISDNLKTFKYVGPSLIGVGVLMTIISSYGFYNKSGNKTVTSNFGFKFY